MATGCSATAWPGRLDSMLQREALVRLHAQHEDVGLQAAARAGVLEEQTGGRLNWMAISVTRLGSRLPVRR